MNGQKKSEKQLIHKWDSDIVEPASYTHPLTFIIST